MRAKVIPVLVLAVIGSTSCASEAPPDGTSLRPRLEAAQAVEGVVGPDGGTLEVTASDGTVATLDVPAGALLQQQTLRLTPFVAVEGLPTGAVPLAGVHFEPDGLELWRGALVTIRLPEGPPTDDRALVGYGYRGAGEGFAWELAGADEAGRIRLPVRHFSGAGVALVAPEDLEEVESTAEDEPYRTELISLVVANASVDALAAELLAWYDTVIAPRLAVASDDDEALLDGIGAYRDWRWIVLEAFDLVMPVWTPAHQAALLATPVGQRLVDGDLLSAVALRAGVLRNNAQCAAEQDLLGAEGVVRWQAVAEALDLATPENALDLETVLADLCVELLITEQSFDQVLTPGVPAPIQVESGPSFDGETLIVPNEDAIVALFATAQGATFDLVVNAGWNDPFIIEAPVTPTGEVELVIEGRLCFYDATHYPILSGGGDIDAARLCQDIVIVRGLGLTPQTAAVEVGDTIEFEATLFGEPHPNATFDATGGTIDEDGTYEAGDAPGSYTVRALSQTTPGLVATAAITIEDEPPPPCGPTFQRISAEIDSQTLGFDEFGTSTASYSWPGGRVRATSSSVLIEKRSDDGEFEEFFASTRLSFRTVPVEPDPMVVGTLEARVRFRYEGPESPEAFVEARASCEGSSVFFETGPGTEEPTAPGEYTFDVDVYLGSEEALECEVAIHVSEPSDAEGLLVEVEWLGLSGPTAVLPQDRCWNP